MDMNTIISLISAIASPLAAIVGIVASSKLTAYRLEQLEEKVNKHNNLIERVFKLEEHNSVQDEKISVANHRIDDLERRNGNA